MNDKTKRIGVFAIIRRAPADVWTAITTAEGLTAWLAKDADVELRIKQNGQLVRTVPAKVKAGEDVVRITMPAPASGLHRYDVEVGLRVGIIIGAAFTTIVKALVDGIMMPIVGYFTGGVDFTNVFTVLGDGEYASLAAAEEAGAAVIKWGVFINAVIAFDTAGPCVTVAAPTPPVIAACPSAISTAPPSWTAGTYRPPQWRT